MIYKDYKILNFTIYIYIYIYKVNNIGRLVKRLKIKSQTTKNTFSIKHKIRSDTHFITTKNGQLSMDLHIQTTF